MVGGIVDLKMFQYPQSSKTVAKWCMRKIMSVQERLVNLPYCEPTSNTGEIDMKMTLPEYVYLGDEPSTIRVAIWNPERM